MILTMLLVEPLPTVGAWAAHHDVPMRLIRALLRGLGRVVMRDSRRCTVLGAPAPREADQAEHHQERRVRFGNRSQAHPHVGVE